MTDIWEEINRAYTCGKTRKRSILEKKLKAVTTTQTGQGTINKPKKQLTANYVINRSNEHFIQEQLSLLNKGLNFTIRNPTFLKEEIVIDIEARIKYASQEEKAGTRKEIERLLTPTKRIARKKTESSNHYKTLKELKKKPVFYLPTDKENPVIIIDKGAYDNLVRQKLEEGKFHIIRKGPSARLR